MYKDSSMKRKEKKKRKVSDVKFQSSILTSHVNHVTDLDIIFFWCDLCNVRVEFLTTIDFSSLSRFIHILIAQYSWIFCKMHENIMKAAWVLIYFWKNSFSNKFEFRKWKSSSASRKNNLYLSNILFFWLFVISLNSEQYNKQK